MSLVVEPVLGVSTPTVIAKSVSFKAVVKSAASKVFPKTNGNEYVYLSVELLDGAAKGLTVLATRTTLSNGVEKSIPAEGEECVVYHTKLPSQKEEGKFVHFFEISTGSTPIADNDELSALL